MTRFWEQLKGHHDLLLVSHFTSSTNFAPFDFPLALNVILVIMMHFRLLVAQQPLEMINDTWHIYGYGLYPQSHGSTLIHAH